MSCAEEILPDISKAAGPGGSLKWHVRPDAPRLSAYLKATQRPRSSDELFMHRLAHDGHDVGCPYCLDEAMKRLWNGLE